MSPRMCACRPVTLECTCDVCAHVLYPDLNGTLHTPASMFTYTPNEYVALQMHDNIRQGSYQLRMNFQAAIGVSRGGGGGGGRKAIGAGRLRDVRSGMTTCVCCVMPRVDCRVMCYLPRLVSLVSTVLHTSRMAPHIGSHPHSLKQTLHESEWRRRKRRGMNRRRDGGTGKAIGAGRLRDVRSGMTTCVCCVMPRVDCRVMCYLPRLVSLVSTVLHTSRMAPHIGSHPHSLKQTLHESEWRRRKRRGMNRRRDGGTGKERLARRQGKGDEMR